MKATIIAFFGLAATAYSATFSLESFMGALANGSGAVTGGAVADSKSGAAAGATEGDGAVIGAATVGSALMTAMQSPYL